MEVLFAHTYLILFGKLAVGGLLALAVPPFFAMERGFYRSTAAVYLGLAYIMATGDAYLLWRYGGTQVVTPLAVAAWIAFAALFTAYVATLFVERPRVRARLFPSAVLAGFIAIAVTAAAYVPESASVFATAPYVLGLSAGAAVSGAAVTGMLLGHWYLIESGLDLTPLERMLAYCRACLVFEIVVVPLGALALWLSPAWHDAFAAAFGSRHVWLVAGRAAAWALACVLVVLIGRTLAIPQTMAATGLFYIQALTVAVGEILAHWLLFRTTLPL